SLTFEVNRDVLIPRPDTECVVDECLRLTKSMTAPAILDIGTGSGAIPVALARHHETAVLTATDVSAPALEVARRNPRNHGVSGRARSLHGALFAPVPPGETFNVILSNPPYTPPTDIAGLAAGVRDYEPHLALDGGPDGFALFDRLIAAAPAYLKS